MNKIQEKCDLFGIQPHLFMNGKKMFKSKQGFWFSFLFIIFVAVTLFIYGRELFLKEKPITTYTESSNNHPLRYNITKNEFVFA